MGHGRYLVSTWLAFVALASWSFTHLPGRPTRRAGLLVVSALGLASLRVAQSWQFAGHVARLVECVDRAAAEVALHKCVATSWLAKPVELVSRARPVVVQTSASGVPHRWAASVKSARDGAPVDCAVMGWSDASLFVSTLGPATAVIDCQRTVVLSYSGAAKDELNRRLQPLPQRDWPRGRWRE